MAQRVLAFLVLIAAMGPRMVFAAATISGPATLGRGLQDEYTLVLDQVVAGDTPVYLFVDSPDSCRLALADTQYGAASLSVTVNAGRRRASFFVQSLPGGSQSGCLISGVTPRSVVINTPEIALAGLQTNFQIGASSDAFNVKVGVRPVAGGGFRAQGLTPAETGLRTVTVSVSSSNPNAGRVLDPNQVDAHADPTPETVYVLSPASQLDPLTRLWFLPRQTFSATDQTTTVTASAPDFTGAQRQVTVRQAVVRLSTTSPERVGLDLQDTFTLRLEPAAPSATSVTLSVSSSAPCRLALNEDVVGSTSVNFTMDAGRAGHSFVVQGTGPVGNCDITAAVGGVYPPTTALPSIPIACAGVRLEALASYLYQSSDPDEFRVRIGVPDDGDGDLLRVQTVRPGVAGGGIVVKACVEPPSSSVASIPGADGTGCKAATIPVGSSRNPDGAFTLDPATPGKVLVRATGADGSCTVTTARGEKEVTVRANAIALTDASPDSVGVSLQDTLTLLLAPVPNTAFTIDLSVPAGGPCSLAADESVTTGEGWTLPIAVVPGEARYPFTIRGLALSSSGYECTISATTAAPAWPPSTTFDPVEIETPALVLRGLPGSLWQNAENEPFAIEIGVPTDNDRTLRDAQTVRPGTSITVEACVNNSGIAAPIGAAGSSSDCKAAEIDEGQSATAENALLLDPKTPGTVHVRAQSAAADTALRGEKDVVVRATNVRLTDASPDVVGVDLQDTFTVKLEPRVPKDGMGSATITLNAAGGCLLSPNSQQAGGTSVSVTVPQGRSSAKFVVQGVAEGDCTITAASITRTDYPYPVTFDPVQISCAALRLADGPDSTYLGAPDDPFRIEIGPPNSRSSNLRYEQTVRPGAGGGAGLTVQACVENTAAAGLRDGTAVVDCDTAPIEVGDSSTAPNALKLVPKAVAHDVCVQTSGTACSVTAGRKCIDIGLLALDIDPDQNERRVGEGLRTTNIYVKTNTPVGADTAVTLESLTPAWCLVAQTINSTPSPSIPLTIAKGTSREPFVLHGLLRGDCIIRASTGDIETMETFAVEPAAAEITGLPDTVGASSAQNGLQVRLGVAEADESQLDYTQNASADITVQVCSSDPLVGTLRWENAPPGGTGCVNTVVDRNDVSTDSGQLDFIPQAGGSTEVCVVEQSPIGIVTTAGCQTVVVDPVDILIDRSVVAVGAGLESNGFTLRPSPTNGLPSGGLLVRVSSSTPAACVVSQSGTVAGGSSFDVRITGAYGFWVQAATRNATTCTIAVTPLEQTGKYVGTGDSFPIQQTYVALQYAPSSLTVGQVYGFNARIGLPASDHSDVALVQPVSPVTGAWPITVSLTAVPAGQEKARLETTTPSQSGQQVSLSIPVGGSDVAGSGLAVRGLAAGNTTITVTGASLGATTKATQPLTVTNGSGGGC